MRSGSFPCQLFQSIRTWTNFIYVFLTQPTTKASRNDIGSFLGLYHGREYLNRLLAARVRTPIFGKRALQRDSSAVFRKVDI